jgi:translation initiation factor 2-alpha kinase 3
MRSFVVIASIVIAGVITVLVSFSLGMESTVTESSNQISEDDGPEILPICGNKPIVATAERPKILLVSTLDGRLTALDPNNNGEPLWSIATGPGSMVSSTISQMELTNNAKWVRLIPSLAGGLYKFDGEVVEPIPLSAEELLRTSFKFADNTVMTGGKESRVYGIEVDTGRIKYECSMDGCFGPAGEAMGTTADNDLEDILVVRRVTQVVRAVEPRTGAEKWNFSVSTHHVSFQSGVDELCDQDNADNNSSSDDEDDLKAVVPEGVICKVDKARPDQIRWKQKFGSPIVHAWRLERGVLKPVNLFSNSHLPKVTDESKNDPSIYLGSYKQQLYIQESDLHKSNSLVPDDLPRISWKPYLISADSRTTVINHGSRPNQNELPMLTYDPNVAHDTALAVFSQGGNAEYPYDSGLYLYPEEANLDYDLVEDLSNATSVDNNDDVEEIVNVEDQGSEMPSQAIQIVFVSMWYWWQEIVLISLFTAAVMNIFITRPYIHGLRQGFRRRLDQLTRRRPVSL